MQAILLVKSSSSMHNQNYHTKTKKYTNKKIKVLAHTNLDFVSKLRDEIIPNSKQNVLSSTVQPNKG
jgi:hypothetical protein